jgi:hypothetical protein
VKVPATEAVAWDHVLMAYEQHGVLIDPLSYTPTDETVTSVFQLQATERAEGAVRAPCTWRWTGSTGGVPLFQPSRRPCPSRMRRPR